MSIPISIHALLAESDQHGNAGDMYQYEFLSTLSLRRATTLVQIIISGYANFYPRSPCGERPTASTGATKSAPISIHALLAESDRISHGNKLQHGNFYPRSPCGERQRAEHHASSQQEFLSTLSLRRATDLEPSMTRRLTFLSTLSLRRATLAGPSGPAFLFNFYPRSPCGERQALDISARRGASISIHALLAESD